MDAFAGLEFRHLALLWLLAALPVVLVFLVWRERTRRTLASRIVAERLRGGARRSRFLRPWVLAIALALAAVALAGPRVGYRLERIQGSESSTVILLDTSLSMDADDVGTSRLAAAKAVARHILDLDQGRVGLVVFEGSAAVVAPLTDDHEAVEMLVESIGAGELPKAGSDIGEAIDDGLGMIRRAGGSHAEMVILSDGEQRGASPDDAVKRASDRGIPITTVMIGGTAPARIPMGENHQPLVDEKGDVVETKADSRVLRMIASKTGGEFFENPFSSSAADKVAASLARRAVKGTTGEQETRVPVERFQWPLGAALVLFLVGSILHRGAE